MPNILYIAHRIPYPPNKGDKIRSFNQIKQLSRNNIIDLACLADDPNDLRYEHDLRKYCQNIFVRYLDKRRAKLWGLLNLCLGQSISTGYFYQKHLQEIIDKWQKQKKYDAVICFSSPMAEYIFRSRIFRHEGASSVFIMDFCDLDSDKWLQYSRQTRFPFNLIYRIEHKRLFEYEKKINHAFNHSVFISQPEADLFQSFFPQARHIEVIPNGVDHEYFSCQNVSSPRRGASESPILLFTGAMDYHANVDGVFWFCHEIFPYIQQKFPDVQFYIVGSNPAPQVKVLGKIPGVIVTGFVEDIRPYYHRADVYVAPLRLGRGVQNKVLEAMSTGKAIVTTSKAVAGISAISGQHALVEDQPLEFAQAVCGLLGDNDRASKIKTAARQYILEKFDWQTNMMKFEQFF